MFPILPRKLIGPVLRGCVPYRMKERKPHWCQLTGNAPGRPGVQLVEATITFVCSTDRSRRVVVKARVVRHKASASAPLSAHLRYLERDGVSKEGEPARAVGGDGQDYDSRFFAERCAGD